MRRHPRAKQGVTLIELLIAVTLVALISIAMLFSMRTAYDALGRTNSRLMANRRVLGAQQVLDRQISNLIPAMAPCGEGGRKLYFEGGMNGMRFVSAYSLQQASRGYASVLMYAVIPGEQNEGVRLVVLESPYTGPYSLLDMCVEGSKLTVDDIVRRRPFVLADRLSFCRLSYRIGNEWKPVYQGKAPPSAVRVEMAPLAIDPSRLQMTTMTMLVRSTRDPARAYKDEDEYLY